MHDYWSFRPERSQFSEPAETRRKDTPLRSESARETDLEAVQGMIKRLASEVSLGDSAPDAGRSSPDNAMRASVDALLFDRRHHARGNQEGPSARRGAMAMRRRRCRLRLRRGMRACRRWLRRSPPAAWTSALEPIVGLADHQLHHYEVDRACRATRRAPCLPLAGQDRQLARTGLLPLIDAARLKWAAQMAGSFAEKGQKHCVFSATSAESLTADRFLDELATAYRQREALAGDLVLMFTQADVKAFSGIEWSALTDMRDLGFRFGLIGRDRSRLRVHRAAGGRVRLREARCGRPAARACRVPAASWRPADACRYLGELGLAVIVEQIGDEATRTAVLEAGVPLGQGPLFGPPVMVDTAALGTAAA